jgi:hypothetical protein
MIVNQTETGWEIIYQRAHALLAGQIAYHWRQEERPARWFETLAAITQHDDSTREWEDEDQLTPAGAPLHFRLGSAVALRQPREVTTNSQYQGRWVALLTSMHVSHLYGAMRDDDARIAAFLDEQSANQARWRKELKVSQAEANSAYAIMQWCDALSLILCQRQLPPAGRAIEISRGPDGRRYDAVQREDTADEDGSKAGSACISLTVQPWPFEPSQFSVSIEASYIDQLTFRSDTELRAALQAARIDPITWRFLQ